MNGGLFAVIFHPFPNIGGLAFSGVTAINSKCPSVGAERHSNN